MSRPSEGLAGSAVPGIRHQSDFKKEREARWSHSFVNLERDIRTCPSDLGYHDCGVIRSTRRSISKNDKKASYDSCRTARRKARTCLSARKWNRCGTIFRHRSTVFFRKLGPYPESHTWIMSDRLIAKNFENNHDNKIRCHVHTHQRVSVLNSHL